jgi:hypothetical protein
MKSYLFLLLVFALTSHLGFSQVMTAKDSLKAKKHAPAILFESMEHDFGTIPYNGDGTYDFQFKNMGKTPLIISNCQASCGCTIPNWPKEPIQKGQKGVIKVQYNTTRVGSFQKTVTVTSNAGNSPTIITIKGIVQQKPEEKTVPTKEENVPGVTK